jgi:hypothetical protein
MAEIHAIQNGNWSDTSTWVNGIVPAIDDYVYLDGHKITIDLDVYLGEGVVYANNGSVFFPASHTFTASRIEGTDRYGNSILEPSTVTYLAITFNCDFVKCKIGTQHSYGNLTINGNLDECCLYTAMGGGVSPTITILGDANELDCIMVNTRGLGTIHLTGVLTNSVNFNYTSIDRSCEWYINGGIVVKDNFIMKANPLTGILDISGFIDITKSTTPSMPVEGNNIRINDCILITKSSVTVPESVVLEGYVYGDKVGTLKTVPDNVAIVNLTEQQLQRVVNCATVSTVQKCFEDFKE